MSINSAKAQSIIENTFISAIKKLISNEGSYFADLYVQTDAESGELQIFDAEENLLDKVVIFNWVNSQEEAFNQTVSAAIKTALTAITEKNLFEHPRFLKPFSVSLVDDNFEVIEELLLIDDDTFRSGEPLLKNLDADLDNFLKELLPDLPK
jgi:hypothetical protein